MDRTLRPVSDSGDHMKTSTDTAARLLVASEGASDADLVRGMLRDKFPLTEVSPKAEDWPADFDRHRPQVLILAFKSLEEAERCYLGLYRHSAAVNTLPHRTIVLCGKENAAQAFEMCRSEYFDDYVLFWPMAHDGLRLPMSVHLALRALGAGQAASAVARLTAQARRIADLETLLERQLALGQSQVRDAQQSVHQAQTEVGAALQDLSRQILDDGLNNALQVRDPNRVQSEIGRLNTESVQPPLARAAAAVKPIEQWIGGLGNHLAGPLKAAGELAEHAKKHKPLVLIVDDDEFICKQLSHVLTGNGYEIELAVTGAAALIQLRRRRPDLVLMDFNLPDTDGIEVTRQMKAAAAYSGIPVIMLTGHSEKHVIVDSLKAGAVGFLVKPVDRDALLKKVGDCLHR